MIHPKEEDAIMSQRDKAEDYRSGWDSISLQLKRTYPDIEPSHFGTLKPWAEGGPDPLDGISVYPVSRPTPHWHYISFGMTELYQKVSDYENISGWGFEFTFRIRGNERDGHPMWPLAMMQTLGRYVFESGNPFAPGHYIEFEEGTLPGLEETSEMVALLFVHDPVLGRSRSANGEYQFLQTFCIGNAELESIIEDSQPFIDRTRDTNPFFISDMNRKVDGG